VKVLFLTHRLPFAPNRGDRIRAYHMLRTIARHAQVTVVSLVHDRAEQERAAYLEAPGIRVFTAPTSSLRNGSRAIGALGRGTPLTHALLDSGGMKDALSRAIADGLPDVVLAYCSGMVRFALAPPLERVPLVFDIVDVDSAKWRDLARTAAFPRRWIYRREERVLGRFEALAARRARLTLTVNERERRELAAIAPDARVRVLPNGIDVTMFQPTGAPSPRPRVVFTGVMSYGPNAAGAEWLSREVWPLVRAARPDASLVLAGADPPHSVRRLASEAMGVHVTGTLPDIRPCLWDASVAAAPLLTSRGLQNKVLEALAAGLPAVVTESVAEGLPAGVMPGCRVSGSPHAFAASLIDLLSLGPQERRALAARADLEALTWERQLAPLCALLEDAAYCSAKALRHGEGVPERVLEGGAAL
jgi:polysaccharide biosynthesis protein PslH